MIADRKDVSAVLEKRHSEASARIVPMARLIQGAAVVADGLKRTPEWERYCTYLQGIAEQFKVKKAEAQRKLGDPAVTKDDDVRKLRQDIFIADVTMDTLKFAIELPAAILQGGEEADKFIEAFEKKNETTGNAKS
jgi:hypothetical protein